MVYRARHEGSVSHLVPVDCRACEDRHNCPLRDVVGSHCSKRDRQDRWYYLYYVRDAVTNKLRRKQISAKTRKDLYAKIDKVKEQPVQSKCTVGEWLDIWLKSIVKGSVKTSTYAYYDFMLKYVPEKIREMSIDQLDVAACADLLNKLYIGGALKSGKSLSTTTVRAVRNTLKTALDVAVRQNVIAVNPVKDTRPLRSIRKEKEILTREQAVKLQEVADTVSYRPVNPPTDDGNLFLVKQWAMVIRLFLASGVRSAECWGLTWGCVDFTNNLIKIRHNLTKGKLESVKTASSIRDIPLDAETMSRLRQWHLTQFQYAVSLGDQFKNDLDLVFTNLFGNPVSVNNFRERIFVKMLKAAGISPDVTLHSLRHTHSSFLLEAGVDLRAVSARLGHAPNNTKFTLFTYCHTSSENSFAVAKTVGDILACPAAKKDGVAS